MSEGQKEKDPTQKIYDAINKEIRIIDLILRHDVLGVCVDFQMLGKYKEKKCEFRPFFEEKISVQFKVLDEHVSEFKKLYHEYLATL